MTTTLRNQTLVGGHMTKGFTMKCSECNKPIPAARLKAVPETTMCIKCAEQNPTPCPFDPNEVCAKSADIGRNGFARSD